ncbi:ABC-2 type transport system permease protein [Streptomyces sp. LamerLS-316]|uniref:ABC transporter permease n=1 Tax=unclassified Streptomyces TaxID=2593676 RepID=UPI000823C19B|nr:MULTISPECIES: ABC transporter permease [unclassified Streptomyces]MYQ42016.1 ABC transporter permease [Streptomyces sp. SID4921]SCK29872.1 ABC-2 type transport system permease protein [Streptomyces sp. LamerLS-316]
MSAATTATRAPAPARAVTAAGVLAGTRTLIAFGLRRDRVRLPVWVLALFLGTLYAVGNYRTLYAGPEDRASVAATMDSPAGLAMTGPRHYLDSYGSGAMTGHQMLGFTAVLVALMSILTVTRHTRDEEETNRAELVRSTVVGRHAHLAAALSVAVLANLALALLLAAGLGAMGLGTGGSLLYGASHAAVGIVFASVAAVTAQITAQTRGASGTALAVVGLAYVLRAAGDAGGDDALSWLSPIGWVQRTYVYVDDRWWPLLLCLVLAVLCAGAGFILSTRRDVGAGLRAPRAGSPVASGALTRPLGFALRLHRSMLAGFGAGVFLMGAMYGSILGQADDMLKDIDPIREALEKTGGTMAESFASMVMVVLAVVASVYVVMAALRPRSEENAGRAEPLLATGLSRTRWAGSHLAVALAGGTLLLLLAGLGIGLAGAASAGDSGLVLSLTGAALAYAPALWVTTGVAAVLFGWLPRAAQAAWAVPVYAFVAGYLGPLLRFPGWTKNVSPFGHVPRLPSAQMDWTPLTVLTLVAAGLMWLGLEGFRRRDLECT